MMMLGVAKRVAVMTRMVNIGSTHYLMIIEAGLLGQIGCKVNKKMGFIAVVINGNYRLKIITSYQDS
jgi:hypothetical protein